MRKLLLPLLLLLLLQHLLLLLLLFVSLELLITIIPISSVVIVVEAVWSSELCHTGPKYKVRVDEVTGKIVPMTMRARSSTSSSSDPFYDNNNIMPSTIIKVQNPGDTTAFNSNDTMKVDLDDNDDVVGADHAGGGVNGNGNGDSDSDSDGDGDGESDGNDDDDGDGDGDGDGYDYGYDYGEGFHNDNLNRNRELGFNLIEDSPFLSPQSFRSKHRWREEFDREETADAFIVVNHHHHQKVRKEEAQQHLAVVSAVEFATKQQRFLQQGQPQHPGSDNDDTLKEGEFFLKPCLCPGSRWTFPDSYHDAGPKTNDDTMDDENNNYVTNNNYGQFHPTNTVGSGYAIGKNEEGEGNGGESYYYVRDNVVEGSLLLCQVSAAYCGWGDTVAPNVQCYEQNMTHIIASNAWPLILLWYFGLLMICCCTIHGRLTGDYVHDRITTYVRKILSFLCNYCCCCVMGTTTVDSADDSGGFNHRMLHRMTYDDEHSNDNTNYDRSRGTATSTDTDAVESPPPTLPLYYTPRRRQFERNLWSQMNWMWRHQEYHREAQHRAQGLPPPQLRLQVKRFCRQTTTSGSHGIGFGMGAANNDDGATTHGMTVGDNTPTDTTTDTTTTTSSMGNTSDATTTTITTTTKVKQQKNIKDSSHEYNRDCDEIDDDEHEFITFDLGVNSTEDDNDDDDPQPDHHIHDDGSIDENGSIALAASKADDDDDEHSLEEPTCTICFCPFEEGEKIGDLTCQHEFHVECLKGWAQRKNACPLCNVRLGCPERPATTTYDHHHHITNNNNSSNTDDTRDTTSPTTTTGAGTLPPPPPIGRGRRFIQRLRHVFVDRHNNNNNTTTAVGDYYTNTVNHRIDRSEIQMVNRVGIIASF